MRFKVVAPASSANLGPGFDSLALALGCYLTIDVEPGDGRAGNAQQADLGSGQDMVLQAIDYLAAAVGKKLPEASIQTRSCIPVARGMGSSAAALIAGMLAANRLLGDPLSKPELLKLATELEGHADNLAAALYGGAVLAVPGDGAQSTFHLSINCQLEAAMFVPSSASLTTDARAIVPQEVSRGDAVYNASRCALLVHALATGNPGLLQEAMRDRIHQPYRAALYPHLHDTIDAAISAGAYGASLSGSGPSVLALAAGSRVDNVARAMCVAAKSKDVDGQSMVLDLELNGARVVSQ
jgi:homoserine kinase